jgi:uncharacterized protein YggE
MMPVRMIFAAACAAVCAVAPARAQAPAAPAQPEAAIVVGGEGSVTAAPDYAQISAGATTRAKTAAEAADANAKAMTAVIAALSNAGIAKADIQTAQFSLRPVYASPASVSEQKLTGFAAANEVSVKVRNLDKLGDVLDRLVAAGATDVGNVSFLHADLSKVLDQARQAAIADARRKAEIYAHAAGVSLGAVAWISEDSGEAAPVFGRLRAAAMAAATPIATGEDTLRVHVTVGFALAH